MARPFLSVAIYQPRYGNFQHWALYLHTNSEDTIYEVDGEHPSFTKVASRGKPDDNQSLIQSFHIADIGVPDIATVKSIIDKAKVDNETLEWDYQDYVLETFGACGAEAILGKDDPDYLEVKQLLCQRRHPML